MMDISDPLTLSPFNNSSCMKMKERTPFNQVMTCKASNMQRFIQVMQMLALKSCRKVCQLFCCPTVTQLCEEVTCCIGQKCQDAQDKTPQVALRSLPSTILIVNISNSTLNDCVIGYDSSAVAQSQPLLQGSEHQMHDQARCSCSRGQKGAGHTSASPPPPVCPPLPSAEAASVNIHSSYLNCVIIGDNNYMHAEQIRSTETEEPQV
ncbi:uncharacterized protein LOC123968406 [Micropterus dolomieu]|uniref:uncharacterized protein LOC123968406 n=1 Tax=Micropterus dolomieu TaxID=147949 RepID=UPI001E8E329D|nr:uncharacterized protein LOC123968406 [Micropterus dolomieu]